MSILKNVISELRTLFYSGTNYTCNFCGRRFRKLLSTGIDIEVISKHRIIGAGKRNAGCPRCHSTDRERLIYYYLNNYTQVFKEGIVPLRVLHIAPSVRIAKLILQQNNVQYVLGDLFTEGYEGHYLKETINLDITDTPYPDKSFDLIICNHVLEHIIDDIKAMSEIFRLLDNNGLAILQVPISKQLKKTLENNNYQSPEERLKHFGQHDHVRIYGLDYIDRLETVGFEVEAINFNILKTDQKFVKEYGLNPKEDLYLASKN